MRFLGYARVSTLRQAEEGVSLAAQEAKMRAWAVFQGHEIEIRCEEGVSGAVAPADRPVLRSCLEDLDGKAYGGLVSVALDRISRSTKDVIALVERAEKVGFALVSLRESLDTGSAMGRFVVRLMASLAELEREIIGERTSAAMKQLRREGRPFSRHAPWGFEVKDGFLVPCVREQVISDDIEEHIAAERSLPDIACRLTQDRGFHPRTGKPWTDTSVRNVLRSLERASA